MSSEEGSSGTANVANDWASTIASILSLFEFLVFVILTGFSVALISGAGKSYYDSNFMIGATWVALFVFFALVVLSMASFMFCKTVNLKNTLIFYGCSMGACVGLLLFDVAYAGSGGLSGAIAMLCAAWGWKLSNIL